MITHRRAIAALILVLFTGQTLLAGSELAGAGSHSELYSDLDHPQSPLFILEGDLDSDPLDSSSSPENPAEQNCGHCCHGHSHCHVLAFPGQASSLATNRGSILLSKYDRFYYSLYPSTPFRPPIYT